MVTLRCACSGKRTRSGEMAPAACPLPDRARTGAPIARLGWTQACTPPAGRPPVNVRACSSAVPVLLGTLDPRGHRSAQRDLRQEHQNVRWNVRKWPDVGWRACRQGSKPRSASALCRSARCCAHRMRRSRACLIAALSSQRASSLNGGPPKAWNRHIPCPQTQQCKAKRLVRRHVMIGRWSGEVARSFSF